MCVCVCVCVPLHQRPSASPAKAEEGTWLSVLVVYVSPVCRCCWRQCLPCGSLCYRSCQCPLSSCLCVCASLGHVLSFAMAWACKQESVSHIPEQTPRVRGYPAGLQRPGRWVLGQSSWRRRLCLLTSLNIMDTTNPCHNPLRNTVILPLIYYFEMLNCWEKISPKFTCFKNISALVDMEKLQWTWIPNPSQGRKRRLWIWNNRVVLSTGLQKHIYKEVWFCPGTCKALLLTDFIDWACSFVPSIICTTGLILRHFVLTVQLLLYKYTLRLYISKALYCCGFRYKSYVSMAHSHMKRKINSANIRHFFPAFTAFT